MWSIFEYENDFITTTKEKIDDISYLVFNPKEYNGLLLTVIYYIDGI